MKCTLLILLFYFASPAVCEENGTKLILREMKPSKLDDFQTLVVEILLNTLRPRKCLNMIVDKVYYSVLSHTFFYNFGVHISYFTILVEDSEDLLSPYIKTKRTLLAAKGQDCQCYIILISNGIQVSRLLRFGDRYRVLDTRSNFILLHDNRLFHKDLYYLWKRIINVIFIREYGSVKKYGNEIRALPWFEISTVPFPSPIQSVFIPKRLDIWRKSKFRIGSDLFRDKTSDLRNQTLRVATFRHIPAVTKIPFSHETSIRTILGNGIDGYTGLEIEILATVAKAMNFKSVVYEPANADIELWGRKQPNGHYSGLYEEMISSKADIALGDLYYTSYNLNLMDLTVPYNTECLTFLTPESLTDNSWKTLTLPFKPMMWALVIICLIMCGIIFYYLALLQCRFTQVKTRYEQNIFLVKKKRIVTLPMSTNFLNPRCKYALMKEQLESKRVEGIPEGLHLFSDFFNSMLYTYSMLLMVSLPKLPTGWSLRMLTGWYWLYCTLVVVAYRASMTAMLANPSPRVTIDTLQELVDSQLPCGGWGEISREFFITSLDSTSQIIGSKFETVNDSDEAVERVSEGSFAFYENIYFLKESSVKRQLRLEIARPNSTLNGGSQTQTTNERNLHIMRDCVINMPISIGLQKNSPIKPRVDKFIRKVLEAGLIKKWLDDAMQTTLNAEIPSNLENIKALMNMKKFIGAFVALLIGYFISTIVLVTEMCYFHFVTKKHPNYNKYSRRIY